jgi:hypothetical protein
MRRLVLSFLVAATSVAAVTSGCFTPQPPPPCQVVPTQDFKGNPPYLARFTKLGESGTCTGVTPLTSMVVGVQDFIPPGTGKASLALRPARLVDMAQGRVFSADVDATNDCQAALDGEEDPRCDTCSADGGNPCVLVPDPVRRSDPTDPTGAKLNALGGFPRAPENGRCITTEALVAEQNFSAVALPLVDGGTAQLPALPVRFAFETVSVITTFEVPGTAFTATLAHTEGACTTRYDVVAFYPAVGCSFDADCDPNPDLDAGRTIGSGINPDFKPRCDTTLQFCVPTVDLTKPGLPALP